MSEWQTIDSAPKDGAPILVSGGTVDRNDELYGDLRFEGVALVRWRHADGHWRGDDCQEHDVWMVHKPKYWHPIPEPPK